MLHYFLTFSFAHMNENEVLDNMIRSGYRRLARSFNLCYRYKDELIGLNNKKFLDYLKKKANKSETTLISHSS